MINIITKKFIKDDNYYINLEQNFGYKRNEIIESVNNFNNFNNFFCIETSYYTAFGGLSKNFKLHIKSNFEVSRSCDICLPMMLISDGSEHIDNRLFYLIFDIVCNPNIDIKSNFKYLRIFEYTHNRIIFGLLFDSQEENNNQFKLWEYNGLLANRKHDIDTLKYLIAHKNEQMSIQEIIDLEFDYKSIHMCLIRKPLIIDW